jgi:cell wall-associated NlpC family hydrolase
MTTSRGLFQQIAAWAPEADRLDPVKSATMFFKGGQGGQPGLMSVTGWQRMPVPQAAQAIQGSEFSSGSNYAAVLPQAAQIANAIVPGCSSGSASVGSSVVGAKIVAAVQSQIGTPYVWGGGGPGGPSGRDYVDGRGPGFDCSGLTQWAVYTATGGRVTIPRTAADQRSAGAAVAADFAAMLPGDLIVFGTGHVGVYIGNEQMINAPESTKNVRVDSVGSGSFNGNQATWTVRRIS